jgi:pimeloyl-ACP methyl ester carboxylesterase
MRGSGLPAVVFDAGHGAGARSWLLVQPELASGVQTVSYDRAGLARSDLAPGPGPRMSGQDVDDLRAMLAALEVPLPYVLVGHSYGGMNVRLFAARFPEEVAGLVLVDAVHDGYLDELRALDPVQGVALDEVLAAIEPRRGSESGTVAGGSGSGDSPGNDGLPAAGADR